MHLKFCTNGPLENYQPYFIRDGTNTMRDLNVMVRHGTSFERHGFIRTFDFYLIRRDLALETFRNKFSYLNHSIITSKYKFSY